MISAWYSTYIINSNVIQHAEFAKIIILFQQYLDELKLIQKNKSEECFYIQRGTYLQLLLFLK